MVTHTTTQNRHKQNEQHRQDKFFSPAFIISWLINLSVYLVFYLSITVMALYTVRRPSASDAAGGFAASSFMVGATIAYLFSGYPVNTFGGHRIMLGSLAIIVIVCVAYMWAASLPILIAIRIIHGLTYALASIAMMAAARTAIPASRHAEETGYISLGITLATAIGPALGLTPIGSISYSILFATTLGLSIVGLVLAFFLPQHNDPTTAATKNEATEDSSASEAKRTFFFGDIMTLRVMPIDLFMLLIDLTYASVITFLNRYSRLGGLTRSASFFFITCAVAMITAHFSPGRLQDHRSDNLVIAIGLMCLAISLLVLAFTTADWHVIAADTFCGLGYGALVPARQTISVHLVPAHKLGTGISTLLLLADTGIDLGPIVLDSVATIMGFDKMYAGLAVMVVLTVVFYWFVHGRKPIARHHHADL